jgi:hypothetical protein
MKLHKIYFLAVVLMACLYSCEDPYTPPSLQDAQQYVIEGYIEAGNEAQPTYVMVTNSLAYVEEIGPTTFAKIFVKNAKVVVNDGINKVELQQVCTSQLPPQLRDQALEALGLNKDSVTIDVCLYVDLFDQINRKEGGKYDLTVTVDGKVLTATTTIPKNVPITKFRWDDPPGQKNDTMARLWITIADPIGPTYYRYLTTDKDINQLKARQVSVNDDVFFDGKNFEFPLEKATQINRDTENEENNGDSFQTFGLYSRGDSVRIKWMTIDKPHFEFWNTRDASATRNGPFSSYIRVKTNINGGLGIWGGYSVNNYSLYCPPK